MNTSLDWRNAHAWLAGYSRGLAGDPADPSRWPGREEHYMRGHGVGAENRGSRPHHAERI